jgi:hypothetical protein
MQILMNLSILLGNAGLCGVAHDGTLAGTSRCEGENGLTGIGMGAYERDVDGRLLLGNGPFRCTYPLPIASDPVSDLPPLRNTARNLSTSGA